MGSKILVYNLAVIAIFAILAYFTGKWWIILLSALFVYGRVTEAIPVIIENEEVQEDNADE